MVVFYHHLIFKLTCWALSVDPATSPTALPMYPIYQYSHLSNKTQGYLSIPQSSINSHLCLTEGQSLSFMIRYISNLQRIPCIKRIARSADSLSLSKQHSLPLLNVAFLQGEIKLPLNKAKSSFLILCSPHLHFKSSSLT